MALSLCSCDGSCLNGYPEPRSCCYVGVSVICSFFGFELEHTSRTVSSCRPLWRLRLVLLVMPRRKTRSRRHPAARHRLHQLRVRRWPRPRHSRQVDVPVVEPSRSIDWSSQVSVAAAFVHE